MLKHGQNLLIFLFIVLVHKPDPYRILYICGLCSVITSGAILCCQLQMLFTQHVTIVGSNSNLQDPHDLILAMANKTTPFLTLEPYNLVI